MYSPAPVHRHEQLNSFLHIIEQTILRSYTIQCLLLLHCLSWSAESRIHMTLLILGLVTIIYFHGCRHLARLVYEIALLFSYFVVVLKAVLAISSIFAIYELILNMLGYHSEDYKLFKQKIEILTIEFSSGTCAWVLNTTADGAVVLGPNDVINLCHTIWYLLYVLLIAMGLYMGMPRLEKILRDNFWTNVYFTVLMVVVWKIFESLLFNGLCQSAEIRRVSCVYVHYLRFGEAGFKSTIVNKDLTVFMQVDKHDDYADNRLVAI